MYRFVNCNEMSVINQRFPSYSEISPFAGTESTVELGLEAKGCTLYKNSPVVILSVVDQLVEILEL